MNGKSEYNQLEVLNLLNDYSKKTNPEKDSICRIIAVETDTRIRDINDEDVLEFHKKLLIQAFDDECQKEIQAGFVSTQNGFKYRTNRDDQINFIGQYLMLKEDESVTELFWKTEDAGQQLVSREVFFNLYKEGMLHKNNTIIKFWNKKKLIEEVTSHEELKNMSWDKEYVKPEPIIEEPIEEEKDIENEIILEPEGPGSSIPEEPEPELPEEPEPELPEETGSQTEPEEEPEKQPEQSELTEE